MGCCLICSCLGREREGRGLIRDGQKKEGREGKRERVGERKGERQGERKRGIMREK